MLILSATELCFDNFGADNASMYNISKIDIDFVKFDLEYARNFDEKRYNEKVTLLMPFYFLRYLHPLSFRHFLV